MEREGLSKRELKEYVQVIAATIIALLFLATVLPSVGRIEVDYSTEPPTSRIVDRFKDGAFVCAVVSVPWSLIVVGTLRKSEMAIPGWVLLFALWGSLFFGRSMI